MKTIFPQYVLLRKHLQGQVLETNKYPLILAYVRRYDQMKRKNGRVHTYDTDLTNWSTKLTLPDYNNFMVTIPREKIFKIS